MKAATLAEIKRELAELQPQKLVDLALRMAKYKKENKELLTYLLFEVEDLKGFIQSVKEELDGAFAGIKNLNAYYAAKSLRKILRSVNKYIKFAGSKQLEADLLLYYCRKMKDSGIRYRRHTQLLNLYERQIQKIQKAITTLHEDLQYDYTRVLQELEEIKTDK